MFWDIFYSLCQRNNEKPNNVARKVKISSGLITKWKQGAIPNTEALIKLSDYFEVSIDYLLGRTEEQNVTYTNVNSSNIVNGSNGDNSPLTVNQAEALDEMSSELLKSFQKLSFEDKLVVLNGIIAKSKKVR